MLDEIRYLRVLLEHDADVTGRHPDGRSLVQLARDKGSEEIVNLLQEHGAKVYRSRDPPNKSRRNES